MKHVPPSVRETAFNCPHCGALTTQYWHSLRADRLERDAPLPLVADAKCRPAAAFDEVEDPEERRKLMRWADLLEAGDPFFWDGPSFGLPPWSLYHVHVSQCFNCEGLSLWIYDRLVYPLTGKAPPANPDLPEHIRRDYEEAGSILDHSPRGAAALLRLAIQKLCKELGQSGNNINTDIPALVAGGLRRQRAHAIRSGLGRGRAEHLACEVRGGGAQAVGGGRVAPSRSAPCLSEYMNPADDGPISCMNTPCAIDGMAVTVLSTAHNISVRDSDKPAE